ncbi:MAG TPA: 5-oxoprolinase, partial [Hellea balneolensis]|nr:5-oxoprolinase [Hellea balneolensis]
PVLRAYVQKISTALTAPDGENSPDISFMQSSGGLANLSHFYGRNAVLSGPAGGVIGAVKTAKIAGFDKLIGFDMGGTSTDVCHFSGQYERARETLIEGQHLRTPMLEIHTVAAGGGSILDFDGKRFSVGPASAGANPGPACYRRGGPLTVTDINVVLGKINPLVFPHIFGPEQNQPIDIHAAQNKFQAIAEQCGKSIEETAEGFLEITVDHMARAIKKISLERGHDLDGYTLVCFGGAGAQHACKVADALGIGQILIHPFAGVLSAYGMSLADYTVHKQQQINRPLDACDDLFAITDALANEARRELAAQKISPADSVTTHTAYLRYENSDTALAVEFTKTTRFQDEFERLHKARYSFTDPLSAVIVESTRVELSGGGDQPDTNIRGQKITPPLSTTKFFSAGKWQTAPICARHSLAENTPYKGPMVIIDQGGTNIVEPGWQAVLQTDGQLLLTRVHSQTEHQKLDTNHDPVRQEVMNNLFMSIAEQMGVVLKNTARSVNIKERLDFSCAIFDKSGGLVANAPHMPVHIGSMDVSLGALLRAGLDMKPGDSFVHNNPYDGGTHLPDINVLTPVFIEGDDEPAYFVVSRGHHADIGGSAPGSMSPTANSIEEEGVIIDCMYLVRDGEFQHEQIFDILNRAQYPARNPLQNIADLKAQIAANTKGAQELISLCAFHSRPVVNAYMAYAQDYGEHCVRRAISSLTPGKFIYEMDQGSHICVEISLNTDTSSAIIDFTGTSPQRSDNFNAPRAVAHAAVLYVFRCLVGEDIPLNAGCMRPLEIIIPDGTLLSPKRPAAIVAGNVELSQMVTNALFAALGVLGTSQGTMNNLTFGDEKYQYYETICSGAPAGPGFHGKDAVQTHMTNSRLTDPEILELRFPVRLQNFEIMRGSGGQGQWHAGDGVRRAIEFLSPMQAAILSSNRKIPCSGINGGSDGRLGQNTLIKASGERKILSGCVSLKVEKGDILIVETPTGGGYGAADD